MRASLWIALVCLSVLAGGASADTGFLDRTVKIGAETYRYQVYVPPDWRADRKWLVVLYLHGSGARGSDGLMHTNGTPGNVIRAERNRFDAVFIFPQCREVFEWSTPAMQEMAMSALDAAVKEFNGDTDRIYLTGFSLGARGVIRMAAKWPERFAAVVDIAGATTPNNPPRDSVRLAEDLAAHPFLARSDPFAGVAQLIKALPIWVFHGDADKTIPVTESRQLVAALKGVGANVRYTEYSGEDHNPTAVKAWQEKDLMAWLLAQRRRIGTN